MADTETKTPLEANGDTIAEIKTMVDGLPEAGGGDANPTAVSKAVNFIDYDGTIRYSYTLDEVAVLTELPALPVHDGLVCQGWNWTLADIKALGREVTVGAMYITDDGKTRLYITIDQTDRMTVPIWLTQAVANGVTVDWGDGSAVETSETAESEIKFNHTYAMTGDYVIRLGIVGNGTVTLGRAYDMGMDYTTGGLFGDYGTSVYSGMLTKVEVGSTAINFASYAFRGCKSLRSITLPNGFGNALPMEFASKSGIDSITLPGSVASIPANAFDGANISSISIPKSVTAIGTYAFRDTSCRIIAFPDGIETIPVTISGTNLTRIIFPSGVTSISESSSIRPV